MRFICMRRLFCETLNTWYIPEAGAAAVAATGAGAGGTRAKAGGQSWTWAQVDPVVEDRFAWHIARTADVQFIFTFGLPRRAAKTDKSPCGDISQWFVDYVTLLAIVYAYVYGFNVLTSHCWICIVHKEMLDVLWFSCLTFIVGRKNILISGTNNITSL